MIKIKYLFFLLSLCINPCFALTHVETKDILLNTISFEIYERVKDLDTSNISLNDGRRGEIIVERSKKINRDKIARMRGIDPRSIHSGADIVTAQKENTKKFIKHISIEKKELERLKDRALTHKEWAIKYIDLKSKWDFKKRNFIKNISSYKVNLADIPIILPVSKNEHNKSSKIITKTESVFVNNSFELPVRDQKDRSTCSSFSGIRAIEIMAKQLGKPLDLSEQYFYWASKPKCREQKCLSKGSWVGHGLSYSKMSSQVDIPSERSCSYVESTIQGNDTQIPLQRTCSNGIVKVESFSYQKNIDDLISSLTKNIPVIIGVKLTKNFYLNNGLILQQEKDNGSQVDSHAKGHSLLIVGSVKLPKGLNEGKYCFVVTNSWGLGWGFGGHSCISEKWLINNRQSNPFVTVNSILLD